MTGSCDCLRQCVKTEPWKIFKDIAMPLAVWHVVGTRRLSIFAGTKA